MSINEELVLSDIIEQYTLDYGRYVIDEMFPNYIDGLKVVIRRALWSLKDKYPKFVLSSDAVSLTATLHNHSNESIYQSIIRLCQSFSVLYPLFELKGDEGSYSGDHPSASRYTFIKISEFGHDVYFKHLDTRLLSYKKAENLVNYEPRFLIPVIPMSLILYNNCVGFGFTSQTLSYSLDTMMILLKEYFNHKDNTNFNYTTKCKLLEKLKNKVYITTPIINNIINKHDPIVLEGLIDFIDNKTIKISTLPYGIPFNSVNTTMIQKLKSENYISDIKEGSDSGDIAEYLITFKNTKDIYIKVLEILKSLRIYSKFRKSLYFSKDNFMIKCNEFDLIEYWYKHRYEYMFNSLTLQLSQHKKKLLELTSKLLISKYPKIKDIISNSKDDEDSRLAIKKYLLSKNEKITLAQSNFIINTKLKEFNRLNISNIQQEIKSIQNKISVIQKQYNNIDQSIYQTCENITKKYKRTKHISRIPKYIGYIVINDQMVISIEDIDQLKSYQDKFKDKITYVYIGKFSNNEYQIPFKISSKIYNKDFIYYDLIQMKYKSKFVKCNHLIKKDELIFKENKNNHLVMVQSKNDKLYLEKINIKYSKDLMKLNNVLYIKNEMNHYQDNEYLVFYWLEDQPNKIRVKYVNMKDNTLLPIRYGYDIKILEVINIKLHNRPWGIVNLIKIPEQYRGKYSFNIINIYKLIKYLSKHNKYITNGYYKDINLNRFKY